MVRMPRSGWKNLRVHSGGAKRFEEQHHASVDAIQDPERRLDIARTAIRKLGPQIFRKRLDGRLFFGQCDLGRPYQLRCESGRW